MRNDEKQYYTNTALHYRCLDAKSCEYEVGSAQSICQFAKTDKKSICRTF